MDLASQSCEKGVIKLTRLSSVLEQNVTELAGMLISGMKSAEREVLVVGWEATVCSRVELTNEKNISALPYGPCCKRVHCCFLQLSLEDQ